MKVNWEKVFLQRRIESAVKRVECVSDRMPFI
jgi:hypothetical protein